MRTMFRVLIMSALVALFASCITHKKREDIFHRHARENRADVLKYCPVPSIKVVKGQPDTTIIRDTSYHRVPVYITEADTVWADCPGHEVVYQYIDKVDTIMQENTAKIEELMIRNHDLDKRNAVTENRLSDRTRQSSARLKWAIAGWLLLVLSVALRFLIKL